MKIEAFQEYLKTNTASLIIKKMVGSGIISNIDNELIYTLYKNMMGLHPDGVSIYHIIYKNDVVMAVFEAMTNMGYIIFGYSKESVISSKRNPTKLNDRIYYFEPLTQDITQVRLTIKQQMVLNYMQSEVYTQNFTVSDVTNALKLNARGYYKIMGDLNKKNLVVRSTESIGYSLTPAGRNIKL